MVCLEKSLYALQTVGIAATIYTLFLIALFVIQSIYTNKLVEFVNEKITDEKNKADFVSILNSMRSWTFKIASILFGVLIILYLILR